MQHLQQVDEHVYKYASTQNRQDDAKYQILWVGDGRMQHLLQVDEQVFMKVVMAGLDKKVPKTPSHDQRLTMLVIKSRSPQQLYLGC